MLDTSNFDINFTDQTLWGSLVLFEIVVFIVLLINIVPGLAIPFFWLSTLVHELGHATMTRMTGGKAKGIRVFAKPQQGAYGDSESEGGNLYLILPAGYLAPTMFSVALILLSALPYCASLTLAVLGLILIFGTLNFAKLGFVIPLGIIWGIIFIWVALKADLFWSMFLLFLVAVQIAFIALAKLRVLGEIVRNDPEGKSTDDATRMAALFKRWPLLRSPMFWVKLWTLFSFMILLFSIGFTWLGGLAVYSRIAQH
jgi:hypothetical protein